MRMLVCSLALAAAAALVTIVEPAGKPAGAESRRAMDAYDRGDHGLARQEFARLANLGSAPAEAMLAVIHGRGLGVPRSERLASMWLMRAAEHGYGRAQVEIAENMATGRGGMQRDVRRAYGWMLVAIRRMDPVANEPLRRRADELGRALSVEQRRQVEEWARGWRPTLMFST